MGRLVATDRNGVTALAWHSTDVMVEKGQAFVVLGGRRHACGVPLPSTLEDGPYAVLFTDPGEPATMSFNTPGSLRDVSGLSDEAVACSDGLSRWMERRSRAV